MSLLLEALKKAALEKRSRGESEAAEGAPESGVTDGGFIKDGTDDSLAESAEPTSGEPPDGSLDTPEPSTAPQEQAVNAAKASYLARQEARRAPAVIADPALDAVESSDESLAEGIPEPDTGAAALVDDDTADSILEHAAGDVDEPSAGPDPDFPPDPLGELSLPESVAPASAVVGASTGESIDSDQEEPEHDLDLDLPAEFAADLDDEGTILEGQGALGADDDPYRDEDDEDEDEDDVDGLLDVAGPRSRLEAEAEAIAQRELQRQALQQLMQRTRQIDRESHRRGALMYAALTLTAVSAIGVYYYFLSRDNVSLLSPMPTTASLSAPSQASAGSEDSAAEAEAVTVAADATATEIASEPESAGQSDSVSQRTAAASPGPASLSSAASSAAVSSSAPASSSSVPATSSEDPSSNDSYAASLEAAATTPRLLIKRRQTPRLATVKVKSAYAAYQAGDLDRAAALYDQALLVAPDHRDALLGAASIAVQQGRYEQALKLYQQRLADDAQDPYARSGLLSLAGQGAADPSLQSEVKSLLVDYPRQAHLHFLLGSLQAADGNWASAQLAFFNARANDRDNPDYAYNLAVALEHIRKPEQALDQYRDAVAMARSASARFDTATAQKRIRLLEDRLQ